MGSFHADIPSFVEALNSVRSTRLESVFGSLEQPLRLVPRIETLIEDSIHQLAALYQTPEVFFSMEPPDSLRAASFLARSYMETLCAIIPLLPLEVFHAELGALLVEVERKTDHTRMARIQFLRDYLKAFLVWLKTHQVTDEWVVKVPMVAPKPTLGGLSISTLGTLDEVREVVERVRARLQSGNVNSRRVYVRTPYSTLGDKRMTTLEIYLLNAPLTDDEPLVADAVSRAKALGLH